MVKRCIEQSLRIKNFEARNWKYETKRRGQESGNKTVWTKNSRRLVGSGKPTGSVWKETIAVSVTISISVQNRHSRILLRALLRSRVWEMHREPEVLEAESPSGKMARLPCKDYLKGTCTNYSVKNGILQNACSTSRRKDADLVITALTRIARLKNSLAKGLERTVTKVQWLCWRRMSITTEQGDLLWMLTHQIQAN